MVLTENQLLRCSCLLERTVTSIITLCVVAGHLCVPKPLKIPLPHLGLRNPIKTKDRAGQWLVCIFICKKKNYIPLVELSYALHHSPVYNVYVPCEAAIVLPPAISSC